MEFSYSVIAFSLLIVSILVCHSPIGKILKLLGQSAHAFADTYNDSYGIDSESNEKTL